MLLEGADSVMKKRQTFAAGGAGLGIVAAAVSASPLTIVDLVVGGVITRCNRILHREVPGEERQRVIRCWQSWKVGL